jgi:metal-sulfur cluster biosynthetic enzyme
VGTAVVGGLVVSTFMTLTFTCMYCYLSDQWKKTAKERLTRMKEEAKDLSKPLFGIFVKK